MQTVGTCEAAQKKKEIYVQPGNLLQDSSAGLSVEPFVKVLPVLPGKRKWRYAENVW